MDKAVIAAKPVRSNQFASLFARLRGAFAKPEEGPMSAEKRALLSELDETLYTLRCARLNFEQASSPDIIEACIYEIKSAESRYCHLLRKAKQIGLTQQKFQALHR